MPECRRTRAPDFLMMYGIGVGNAVGLVVGAPVGIVVGSVVGRFVGLVVGAREGAVVGDCIVLKKIEEA